VWAGFSWLGIKNCAGPCGLDNETSDSIKGGEFLD
jgi:hypothetical protein